MTLGRRSRSGNRFGRGGATTFPGDLVNSDRIVIMGSNMAENYPVAFQWVIEARLRGATVIHVDPRFTRTSALARRHVPIRARSDIVFLGALVSHVLSGGHQFRGYVLPYTNTAALVPDDFRDTEDLGGLFSGWDEQAGRYDPASWRLTGERDETLEHPRCVFQVLKRHFARYTPELAEQVCGVPRESFAAVADAVTGNSGRDRTTALVYSAGIEPTPHPPGGRIPVKYYLTAMLFIVADIEITFPYPWAVTFGKLGAFGLVEMVTFVITVLVGYTYVAPGRPGLGLEHGS